MTEMPTISTPNPFDIEIILDVLSGCKWQCDGCNIDRRKQFPFSNESLFLIKNYLAQYSEMNSNSIFNHIEFGPVDFSSSKNFYAIFEQNEILDLAKLFQTIFFTTTLNDYTESIQRASLIKKLLPRQNIELFVPFNFKDVQTNSFRNLVSKINEIVKNSVINKVYAFPMGLPELSQEELQGFIELFKKNNVTAQLFFNTTCTRSRSAFQSKTEKTRNSIINNVLKDQKLSELGMNQDVSHLEEKTIKRGFYFNQDQLYRMPYLNQFLINQNQRFVIDLHQSAPEQDDYFFSSQAINMHDKVECLNCTSLDHCQKHYLPATMDELNTNECINPEKYSPH